jgi:hypothetical protein
VRNAAKSNNRMSAFITGVINSPAFRMAKAGTPETTEAAGQR